MRGAGRWCRDEVGILSTTSTSVSFLVCVVCMYCMFSVQAPVIQVTPSTEGCDRKDGSTMVTFPSGQG